MKPGHFHGVFMLKQKYENFDYFVPKYFVLEYLDRIAWFILEIMIDKIGSGEKDGRFWL